MTITLDPEAGAEPAVGMLMMRLTHIDEGQNPRRYFDPAKHAELVASIRARGVLQPLLIRTKGAHFEVVAGHRRRRAAIEAFGEDGEVPVMIREMTDLDARIAAIAENDDRDDTSETEQADAAAQVLADCDGDRAEAARLLCWSPSKLNRRLALAGLTLRVKTALDQRQIKVGHAELLAAVPEDKQDKALTTILGSALDVAQTRAVLQRMTQNLAAAEFDKTECATCQFNSARQCALFETHVDDGHCTNAPCFELKTEAAQKALNEAKAAAEPTDPESGAASGAIDPAAQETGDGPAPKRPSTPASSPSPSPAKGSAPAAPKPAAAPKVTAQSIAARAAAQREKLWRETLAHALVTDPALACSITGAARSFILAVADDVDFIHVGKLAQSLVINLRDRWKVDAAFLNQFGKDELKFIAQECGLVEHMGEKEFGKLLRGKPLAIAAGMLAAEGFDWSGRLPSAITLDGAYAGPPTSLRESQESPGEPTAQAEPVEVPGMLMEDLDVGDDEIEEEA